MTKLVTSQYKSTYDRMRSVQKRFPRTRPAAKRALPPGSNLEGPRQAVVVVGGQHAKALRAISVETPVPDEITASTVTTLRRNNSWPDQYLGLPHITSWLKRHSESSWVGLDPYYWKTIFIRHWLGWRHVPGYGVVCHSVRRLWSEEGAFAAKTHSNHFIEIPWLRPENL